MDSSFVSIGGSLTVKEAINKALPYLLDANQQLFEIDSDSNPRLIHLRVTRSNGQAPWSCTLQNSELSDLAKIYDHEQAEFNPPRIVNGDINIVVGPRTPNEEPVSKDPFLDNALGKVYLKGDNQNPWDSAPLPDFDFSMNLKDVVVPDVPPVYPTDLRMQGEQRYRTHQLAEVGTYIIPICYHRTTDKGFESIQVLRSDASFWPMPIHQVWSMQDNWQDLWRWPDREFDPTIKDYNNP